MAEPPAEPPADPAGPPPGGRWWADADRALAEAGGRLRDWLESMTRARLLVGTATRADAADETAWRASPAGRVTAARDTLAALAAAGEAERAALVQLLAATGGGGLAERPRLLLVDAVTGALRGLTDFWELRRAAHCGRSACRRRPEDCTHDLTGRPGLGAPPPTDGYRPSAALDRWVRTRDRRCRFPGCRRRVPRGGELDHLVRHPDGPTAAWNLGGFCTGNHRGKHQAPGWDYELDPTDAALTVTTPSGITTTTTVEPPPF